MNLLNKKLKDKLWIDVDDKVLKHLSYGSPVRNQIRKNFGYWWSDNNSVWLKIYNPKMNIRNDLDETD